MEFGTDRVRLALKQLGNPQEKLTNKVIQISGTNGKGTTSYLIKQFLLTSSACARVGLFTSPYLIQITDSIQINFEEIASTRLAELKKKAGSKVHLTNFELLTISAILYFVEENTDLCIIECGLGGLLDATNVFNNSLFDVVTRIDLDHLDVLGSTIKEITTHKMGITKQGGTVIASQQEHQEAKETIHQISTSKGIKLILANKAYRTSNNSIEYVSNISSNKYKLRIKAKGEAILENLGTSIEAIEMINAVTNMRVNVENIQEFRIRGRMEELKVEKMKTYQTLNFIVDGCHNINGVNNLTNYLRQLSSTFLVVYATTKTKNYLEILQKITGLKNIRRLYCVEFSKPDQMEWIQPQNASEIRDITTNITKEIDVIEQKNICTAIDDIFDYSSSLSYEDNVVVVVCGSLYLVSDFYRFMNTSQHTYKITTNKLA